MTTQHSTLFDQPNTDQLSEPYTQHVQIDQKKSHLFVLQCSHARIAAALQELQQVWQAQHVLLLMEDAVFALHHLDISTFTQVYVLSADAHLIPEQLTATVQCIDYAQFANLIAQSDKVHTWR